MAGETDRDYDFESDPVAQNVAGYAKFDAIERAFAHQNAVLASPVFPPRNHSGWFEEHPGDASAFGTGGTVRTLARDLASDEENNQEYYWGVRFRVPNSVNPIPSNLIWELHHPYTGAGNPGNMDFGGAIAPFAIHFRDGGGTVPTASGMQVTWRTSTGNQPASGGPGPTFEPNMRLATLLYDTWIAVLIHIKFKEDNTGVVEVWCDTSGTVNSSFGSGAPQYAKYNFQSMFWNGALNIHPQFYFLMGLYTGSTSTDRQSIVIFDGCWRRTTKAAAVAKLVGAPPAGQPPVNTSIPTVSGAAQVGHTLTASTGTWSGSTPISYTYQWQKDGVDIVAATNSTYTPVIGDIGGVLRVVVRATNNVAGPISANSANTSAVIPAANPTPTDFAFTGNWTTPSLVNSRTTAPSPEFSGNWTTPLVVHPYNPKPKINFNGNWSSPRAFHPWLPPSEVMLAMGELGSHRV